MEWALYSKLVRCEIRITAPSSPLLRGGRKRPLPNKGQIRQEKKQREREKKKKIVTQKNRNPNLYKCCFDIYKKTSVSVNRENWETVEPLHKEVWL